MVAGMVQRAAGTPALRSNRPRDSVRELIPKPPHSEPRLTWRNARALLRWLRLRLRYRHTLARGLFFVDAGAEFDISPGARVEFGRVVIGRDFTCRFRGRVRIGDHTQISRNCYFSNLESLEIGEGCLIGEGTSIHDMDHGFGASQACIPLPERGFHVRPIKIGDDVWIGSHASILRGSVIGDDVVVAAGSVVSGTVPSHCLVAGVPARVIKSWA